MASVHLLLDPCHEHGYGIALLCLGELPACRYAVPFFEATAAAACRGVLGEEHGMTAHGGLPAVVGDVGGRQPFGHEVLCMLADCGKAFFADEPGYWKLLIDRRMYDTKGRFQDLTPVTIDGFTRDLCDPEKTNERFAVTRVADEAKTKDIVERALEIERERGYAKTDRTRSRQFVPKPKYDSSSTPASRATAREKVAERYKKAAIADGRVIADAKHIIEDKALKDLDKAKAKKGTSAEELKRLEDKYKQAKKERENAEKAVVRRQSLRSGKAVPVSHNERVLRDEVIDRIKASGVGIFTDAEFGQELLDRENGGNAQVRLQSRLSTLSKAANTIRGWIANNRRGRTFTIELPQATQQMVRKAMGRDFDSHNITANGVAHAQINHGVKGKKLNENSIPLTEADMELIPYIMTAPDYVRKGSEDVTGRTSVRFYKELSNGYVAVAEKEYKNSPDDMEAITMWAELSDKATNAQRNAAPDTHVQNAILDIDAAKIRRDAEEAIANDNKIRLQKVYHGGGADFDHFDHSHMGEGQGAQAYGRETYVIEVEGIG